MAIVKPEAIVIGVGIAILGAWFLNKSNHRCSDLDGIWSGDDGDDGFHITQEAALDVLSFMKEKIQYMKIGGIQYNAATLALYGAIYLAPECDWPESINLSKKTADVWISLNVLAEKAIAEDNTNGS